MPPETRHPTYEELQQSLADARAALASAQLHSLSLDQIHDLVTVTDLEGTIQFVNEAVCRKLGMARGELIGRHVSTLGEDEVLGSTQDEIFRTTLEQGAWQGEIVNHRADGGSVLLECHTYIIRDDQGRPIRMCGISRDITESRQVELERETAIYLLRAMNHAGNRGDLIHEAVAVMKVLSGCRAVGVRLREGEDFPYVETQGFPEGFCEEEKSVHARDEQGHPLCDGHGRPCFQGLCGKVVSGRTDPALPCFTELGSFWTNNLTAMRADPHLAAHLEPGPFLCHQVGFESLALIPLRYGQESLGLLQFADPRPGQFDERKISIFERMAASLAMGLAQRETADALRDADLRLAEIARAVNVGLWDWDLRSDAVSFSTEWKAQIGYAAHEIPDAFEEWESRLHPDDREATVQRVREAIAEVKKEHSVEFRLRHKDGSYRWIFAQISVLTDDLGAPARALGCHLDITESKLAAARFRESEHRFRNLVEYSPMAVLMLRRGKYIYGNPAAARMLGLASTEDIVGLDVMSTIAPEFHPALEQRASLAEKGRNNPPLEMQIVKPDGSHIWTLSTSVPIKMDGQTTILVVGQDITEQKAKEAEFRQAQKMEAVGRLAAGVAHDFNNQLTVILGYADLLAETDESPAGEEIAGHIRRAAERARSTTSHLLSFSRKQTLKPEIVDVARFLSEIEKPVGRLIGEDIRLMVSLPEKVSPLLIDKDGLHQALINLAVNARDAMPNGGRLQVRALDASLDADEAAAYADAEPGEYVLLEVRDNGVGMDRETLDRLFEPFFTTKEPGKGTGLGMAMVQGFIRQSSGYLQVASGVGQGTTIRIILPPARETGAVEIRPEPAVAKAVPGTTGTILVVEDDENVRDFLEALLSGAGHRVRAASVPIQALELIRSGQFRPDLIISDVVMPEMRGDELAARLKAIDGDLRVLFITGYANVELPAHEILYKPFQAREMLDRVGRLLSPAELADRPR